MTSSHIHRNLCGGLLIVVIALTSLLSGCGGATGSAASDAETTANDLGSAQQKGEVIISLTDAEGDFLHYVVAVTQLTLQHNSGAIFSVLPQSTEVDFAQYVDTSEFLSITQVPRGRYDSASITLDFSNANIIVQDDLGNPVVAEAVDEDGVALGEITVNMNFRDGERFVITRGMLSHLALDFDLNASNSIEFGEQSALVTVTPVLTADTLHQHGKPTRLRGLMAGVDVAQQKISLSVRPFHQRLVHFGDANVYVDENTVYDIDGAPVEPSLGLNTLSELPADSALVAVGQWQPLQRRYMASEIYAGSSVPWHDQDFVKGTVVARDGDVITLRGAVLEQDNGEVTLNDEVQLQINASARISREQTRVTLAEISVGSRVFASGTAISDEQFDVGDGFVRIRPSVVSGTVVGAQPLVIDLQLINTRRLELFDFSGTGSTPENDAEPSAYEIATQNLNLSVFEVGDPIKINGFVASFGDAPSDFYARTLIDVSAMEALLVVNYDTAQAEPAIIITDTGITLNTGQAAGKHHVFRAMTALDLQTQASDATLLASDAALFTIVDNHTVNIYREYAQFATSLQQRLAQGAPVRKVQGIGHYDDQRLQLHSRHIRVVF